VPADDDFDDRCRLLYRSVRDGSVDPAAAFDLGADVLRDYPADERAAKVAALALDQDAAPALLAAAVRALLAEHFQPTFDDEPGWFAALEEALETVKADLRASGLPDAVRLYSWEGSTNVGVDAWAANSTGGGIFPEEGRDPVLALASVADDVQDAVMHSIWGAWPTCPVHRLGVHADLHDGAAVWWCRSGGGHVVAPVGQLSPADRPLR
jgi:ABC-type branched-subunit amino acid transport system substrate-binding protein